MRGRGFARALRGLANDFAQNVGFREALRSDIERRRGGGHERVAQRDDGQR